LGGEPQFWAVCASPGPFKPYLEHADGSRGSIIRLFREIKALGYDARPCPAAPLPPTPPIVRDVTGWITRRPDSLTEDQRPRLKAILERCPELQAACDQVRVFAAMLTQLAGQDLPQWISGARTAELPGIASFARGLEQDLDAVTLGLTTPWSSGPVEGPCQPHLDWGSLSAARRPSGSVVGIEPGEQLVGALERRRCDDLRRDALVYLQPDG
jgi:hypothetical protein